MKKLTKKAMAIVLSVMMLVVFMPTSTFAADATSGDQQSDQQNQAEPTTPPVVEKKLTPNGDGTYNISLSVTGKSESSSESSKADVVVVMDVSGSMKDGTSSYEKNVTGRYGLVDGKYVNLYKYSYGGYKKIQSDEYEGTVYYENGWRHSVYKGERYSQVTRLAVAKKAIGDLATQLLSNNDDASNSDKVTMSLVTFSNVAKIEVDKRTTLTDFQGGLNGLSANGGTNWEAALQTAGTIKARDGAAKYVIFVSDGNPTLYKNGYKTGGTGQEDDDNVETCYERAKDDAKALVTAGWEFYGVGVFGNVDRMQGLVDYAYYGDSEGTATDKYFSASDQTQLMAAFSNIINSITRNFAYSSVVIKDGLTGMVSCGIKEGETGGFTYTRSGGAYGDGQPWEGEGVPTATLTGKQVNWNLGSTPLENGVKYTVSFTVWPSQEAYDLVADLKNGVIEYDEDLTEIVPMTDDNGLKTGDYGLKTNTLASVEYTQIKTKTTTVKPEGTTNPDGSITASDGYTYEQKDGKWVGTKKTPGKVDLVNPDPIPVDCYQMEVQKVWQDEAGEPVDGGSEVTLELLKDGKQTRVTVDLNKGNRWKGSVFLAPGLVVGEDTKKILDNGHDYSLRETSGGTEYYSFSSNTQHPMLVNSATDVVKNLTNPEDISLDDIGTLVGTNTLIPPSAVSEELKILKKVTGKDAIENFAFELSLDGESGDREGVTDAEGNAITTLTAQSSSTTKIAAGGQEYVSFGNVKFSKEGTYVFKVRETTTTTAGGWTYDSTTKEIKVKVEKASDKNELVIASISDTPVFTNSYSAKAATISIPVTKELTGEGKDDFNISNAFTFTLVGASANTPMPADKSLTNPDSDGGTVRFGDITYTSVGTYTYTVTESGNVDGIENDPVPRKSVTVKVEDNGSGQLVATIKEGAGLKFTNKVIEPIELALHAKKTVEGSDAKEAFTFSIRQTNTNVAGADGAVMPTDKTATTSASIKKGQSQTVTFNEITFTKPGTYTFNVKETNETEPPGWTYDNEEEKTITVVVRKTNGVLSATVQNDTPEFTNVYAASAAKDFTIPVEKVLEGTGAPDITGKYTFTLTGKDGAPMPTVTQKTNPDSDGGTVTFGPIRYVSEGTYEYTVTETGSVAHITNDSNATKTITVNVVDNNQGQLVASIKEGNGVTFTNTYAPEPTTAKISVKKDLKGTGAPDITGKYTFKLEAVDNAPMPANNTELTNPSAGGGTVTFGDITYIKAGTYKYTVTESGTVPGITNDSSATKEVTVVVTDNNGQLSAVVNSGKELTFTNTYAPTPTTAALEVTKVLENMKLQENQFTFQLLDNQDNQSNAVQQKQNAADGTVAFDELEYKYPGVYNYTIKEVIPDDADKVKGVTYDNHEVKVTVTVTDTDGKLSAAVEYEGNKTFTNTYNASGKSAIVGLKTLEGKTLKAGKYTFKLEGKDGAPLPANKEVTNDANGYVNFGEINFKLSDLDTADEDKSAEDGSEGKKEGDSTVEDGSQETAAAAASEVEGADDVNSDENKEEDAAVPRTKTFTYTVTEVAGSETGITYDTTPQEFTITVTDDGEGGLTVTTNPPTGEQNAPLFTINNVYTPAEATIKVTKAFIDGRTELNAWDEGKYADEEFEFELKAVGNAPLNPVDSSTASRTVTTSATSSDASFGIYEFDEAGTYEYTITEKNTGSGDVEYDTAPHKVKVVVTEDETTHQLSADVKYDDTEESLTVINRLKPADNAKLNVVKHVVNTNGQPLSVNGEFHVALFSDKKLTHRVSAVKTLEFNGSDPTAKVPFDVTPGRTYYVAETDADGKALTEAQTFDDENTYYICFGDPSGIEDFTDYPQYGEAAIPDSGSADDVVFSNIFDGSKFMILGSITIDKEVKIGKETKAVDGSFYVTAEYSQGNSDTVEKKTVKLTVENGKTQEPATISNLPTNTDITLKETDANGNALENSVYNPIFTYGDKSGETLQVTLTEDASDIDVNLVNSEKLIDVAFDLKWDDYKNRDNTRDEYAVTLFANGVEVEDSTKTFGYDVTEGKWTDLRQYDDDGNEIVYSVKQTVVPENYSSNTDGTVFGLAPDEDGIVHLIDVYRAVTITKKVTDSTGKAIKHKGDFYVTMFADPEGKEIVKDPVKITLDNEKSKTVIIPVPANSLYYLAETDADGNKVDSSFEFIPTFSSTVAEASDDETSIVLTNQAKAGTPADDPDNDTDAKTGDSANLMLMLLALLTSMLIGAVVLIRGRRREN